MTDAWSVVGSLIVVIAATVLLLAFLTSLVWIIVWTIQWVIFVGALVNRVNQRCIEVLRRSGPR